MHITTSQLGRAQKAEPRANRTSPRADIQGLRAVAVLAVIADHLFSFPTGGFVGVDIFFVISGFLITGLLIRERARSGRISFIDFYRRRIRRITPVAVLVLTTTATMSWLIYTASRAHSVLADAFWSFLFMANWNLAITGTDYMQNEGPESPLQHYWSLAVEEQFYMVWPIIIVALLGLTVKFAASRTRLWIFVSILALISGASFLWALHESASAPAWAYFSTVSRAWELGFGAILAALVGPLSRLQRGVRVILGWLGLAGISVSFIVITAESTFPAPWAALPVLCTGLVIASGAGETKDFLLPLTNKAAGYIGDISYSLYLWHWPVIILLGSYVAETELIYFYLVLAVSGSLSVITYHCVEVPIRNSSWLESRKKTRRSKRGDHSLRAFRSWRLPVRAPLVLVGFLAVASGGTTLASLTPDPHTLPTARVAASLTIPTPASQVDASPEIQKIQDEVDAALSATVWPELQPSLDALGDSSWAPEVYEDHCLTVPSAMWGVDCVYGDKDSNKVAVVLGDSIAASWMPAIRAALEPLGYRIEMLTRSSCPVFSVALVKDEEACAEHRNRSISYVVDRKPELVIISNLDSIGNTAAGKDVSAALAEWETGGKDSLSKLGMESEIVMLSAPPRGPNLNDCAVAGSTPQTCTAEVSDFWKRVASVELKAVDDSVQAGIPVRYVDVSSWFCSLDGLCPPFIGSSPVRVDGVHMVSNYTASLGPVLANELKSRVE